MGSNSSGKKKKEFILRSEVEVPDRFTTGIVTFLYIVLAASILGIALTFLLADPVKGKEDHIRSLLTQLSFQVKMWFDNSSNYPKQSFRDFADSDYFLSTYYFSGKSISGYQLDWDINESTGHFVITAYPVNTSLKGLHTFAIMEDKIVRKFIPDNGANPSIVSTWIPDPVEQDGYFY
ncbi:MAG TPA: hypothetical protein VGB30_04365 [bacterium]|jgi:hypothetical protein